MILFLESTESFFNIWERFFLLYHSCWQKEQKLAARLKFEAMEEKRRQRVKQHRRQSITTDSNIGLKSRMQERRRTQKEKQLSYFTRSQSVCNLLGDVGTNIFLGSSTESTNNEEENELTLASKIRSRRRFSVDVSNAAEFKPKNSVNDNAKEDETITKQGNSLSNDLLTTHKQAESSNNNSNEENTVNNNYCNSPIEEKEIKVDSQTRFRRRFQDDFNKPDHFIQKRNFRMQLLERKRNRETS